MRRSFCFGAGLLILAALAQPAAADPMRTVNTPTAGTPHTDNFGTVTLTQSGPDTVIVTVNMTTHITGSTAVFGFNAPSVTLTAANFTLPSGFTLGATNQTEGAFGTFGYTLNCSSCSGNSGPGTLTFDITVNTGFTVSQLAKNSGNYYYFVNVRTNNLVAAFPEPPAYTLLASSLIVLGFFARRRFRTAAPLMGR